MTYWEKIIDFLTFITPKILLAIVIFAVGYALIKIILRMLRNGLSRSKHIDPVILPFVLTLSKILLMVLLVLVCLESIDISVTPLITALGAVGVAVSLALKDSLANILGGSILLVTKPFKVGDYCCIDGEEGSVSEIGFVYTVLNTGDNKKIFIPNGQVTNATVINYDTEARRRLELRFSIDYNADFKTAQNAIRNIVDNHPYALKDPQPLVRMSAHNDSAIEILCRVWTENIHYSSLQYDLLEMVKDEFDRLNINIPYPQMDVHIKND